MASKEAADDWQVEYSEIKHRGAQLLKTGQWSDCCFQFDTEPHQVINAHKLILAMASPVLGAMFYGGVAEKDGPVHIVDVRQEVFKVMLEYVYTDSINIASVDIAFELYYSAKKYIMPPLQLGCTKYLSSNLNPHNVCRVYEFTFLHEETKLRDECLKMMSTRTREILKDSSFVDADYATVLKIFSMESLKIDSELDLFQAAVRYTKTVDKNADQEDILVEPVAKKRRTNISGTNITSNGDDVAHEPGNLQIMSIKPVERDAAGDAEKVTSVYEESPQKQDENRIKVRRLLQQIRFLTLTPREFVSCMENQSFLTHSELLALMATAVSRTGYESVPDDFSTCRIPRNLEDKARTSAIVRSTVNNFNNITYYESVPFYLNNLEWTVYMERHRYDEPANVALPLYLVVSVVCHTETLAAWMDSIRVEISFFESNNKSTSKSLSFQSSKRSWSTPLVWDDIRNYIINDGLTYSLFAARSGHVDPSKASDQLQVQLNKISDWMTQWKIKASFAKIAFLAAALVIYSRLVNRLKRREVFDHRN